MSVKRSISVYDLGLTRYSDVHRLQQRLQEQRRRGDGVDSLLLTEHRPVFTLGRSHPEPNLRVQDEVVREQGIEVVQTERGGDITYHGPGQLVAYGIIDLRAWDLGVVDYVTALEATMIAVLADWGVWGDRRADARGVWVDGRKIGSVGLHVRRFVSMHGAALNVEPNMDHIGLMNPCGIADAEMTSLAAEVDQPVALSEVSQSFVFHFARVLECEAETVSIEQMAQAASG